MSVAAKEPKLPKFKNDTEINNYFKNIENKMKQGKATSQEEWQLKTYKKLLVNYVDGLNGLKRR